MGFSNRAQTFTPLSYLSQGSPLQILPLLLNSYFKKLCQVLNCSKYKTSKVFFIYTLTTPWLSSVCTGNRWKADMSSGLLE